MLNMMFFSALGNSVSHFRVMVIMGSFLDGFVDVGHLKDFETNRISNE
jgi:hypothetical protein